MSSMVLCILVEAAVGRSLFESPIEGFRVQDQERNHMIILTEESC